jgi:hypothetical protein
LSAESLRTLEAEDAAAEKAVRGLAAEAAISSSGREVSGVAAAAEKARNERHYLFLKLRKVSSRGGCSGRAY